MYIAFLHAFSAFAPESMYLDILRGFSVMQFLRYFQPLPAAPGKPLGVSYTCQDTT